MQKLVYSMEQMGQLKGVLDHLNVKGVEQASLVIYAAKIIDSPMKVMDEPIEGIDYGEEKEEIKGE